jgi:hypothetical protein
LSERLRFAKRKLALHGAVLTAGLLTAFHPTLLSGFARLQTDPGDSLLNAYVLEHSWRWLTKPDYVGTYWSPAFFHPQPLALAYSENLLGTAPLYWLLRVACPAMLAYQLWMMLVTALTYVSMAAVLRRFGVGHLLAALGGFLFAFGLPRVTQIGHQQMLPHLFAPWAVLAAWSFLQWPAVRSFAGLLAATIAQLLAGMYLGWFLLLGLAVFAIFTLASAPALLGEIAGFVRRRWPAVFALLAAWAGLTALLLAQYRAANEGFHRPYDEVRSLTPRPVDWITPAPQSVWAGWLPESPTSELWLFVGFVPLGLAACGLAVCAQSHKRPCMTTVVTALLLTLLATRFDGWSAWRAVYRGYPGGDAIRAVGRMMFTVELFALIGGLVAVDGLLQRTRYGVAVAGLLLSLGIVEQIPIRPLPSFEIAPWQDRVAALRDRLTPGTVAYVDLSPGRTYYESQLTGMWAGLEANVPVVNGYSGRYPPGYPDWSRSMTDVELKEWMSGAAVIRIKE